MRASWLSILLLASSAVSAGTLEQCRQKEPDEAGIRACVQTEHLFSINRLRKTSIVTLIAVRQKTQESGRTSDLLAYRGMQARYVRERTAHCHKQAGAVERTACETDMNYAQIAQLGRFAD